MAALAHTALPAALTEIARLREVEIDGITGETQQRIYDLLNKLVPDAHVDGSGCDSGDPVDLTLAEVAQAINHVAEERDSAIAEAARLRAALEAVGCQGWPGGSWMRCSIAPDPGARFRCVVCRALAPAQQAETDKETK